jgi:hypothetical protein
MEVLDFVLARLGLMPGICRVCGCTDESGCAEGWKIEISGHWQEWF